MGDFREALRAQLARNEEVERARADADAERRRREAERRAEEERRRREEQGRRDARHAELVSRLQELLGQLGEVAPESFAARAGWTASGEEFVAKVSTVQMSPRRSLFVELDRDDDEVLARWTSEVGESIEMWRLLEFSPEMLSELVLTIVDQERWVDADRPPAFPAH